MGRGRRGGGRTWRSGKTCSPRPFQEEITLQSAGTGCTAAWEADVGSCFGGKRDKRKNPAEKRGWRRAGSPGAARAESAGMSGVAAPRECGHCIREGPRGQGAPRRGSSRPRASASPEAVGKEEEPRAGDSDTGGARASGGAGHWCPLTSAQPPIFQEKPGPQKLCFGGRQ